MSRIDVFEQLYLEGEKEAELEEAEESTPIKAFAVVEPEPAEEPF